MLQILDSTHGSLTRVFESDARQEGPRAPQHGRLVPWVQCMKWILAEEEHNRGSADPFVARTVMQAGRIVPLYELGKDREQGVIHVFNQLRRHLHQCDDISRRLVSEINRKSDVLKQHLAENEAQGTLRLPAAENLTNDVETFLYHAKLSFRELKDVFLHTLGKSFKATTQYKHIADWAENRFGEDDRLTVWLKERSGPGCLNNFPRFISGLRAGWEWCRVVHGGVRRLRRTQSRGGQLGAHQGFHLTRPVSVLAIWQSTRYPV